MMERGIPHPVPADGSVKGRRYVIAGGGGAVGQQLAMDLLALGADVWLIDRVQIDSSPLSRLAQATGAHLGTAVAEITDENAARDACLLAASSMGGLDAVVNCAFRAEFADPRELSREAVLATLEVNVWGALCLARSALSHLEVSRGSIINFVSISAMSALGRGNVAYSASKAAVLQLTRELAIEWAPLGVRVNAIVPCQIATPALERRLEGAPDLEQHMVRGIPLGQLAQPGDFTAAVVFLSSPGARMVTGIGLPVDGGNLALNAGGTVGPQER